MTEALYLPDRDGFVATELTRGPWDERFQHAGPPSALIGRCVELLEPAGMRVARFTIEIPKPIPIGLMRVKAGPVRTSRRTQLVEAILTVDDDEVAFARVWRIREEAGVVDATMSEAATAAGPDGLAAFPGFGLPATSYFDGMEIRFARGDFMRAGPAAAWMRMRVPLVADEAVMPLSRVLVVADSGNGISSELDMLSNLFINTELTVHLVSMPAGEWVLLDAQTRIAPDGIGVTTSILSDEQVRLGTAAQALLCARR